MMCEIFKFKYMDDFIIVWNQYWSWVLVILCVTVGGTLLLCWSDLSSNHSKESVYIIGVVLLSSIGFPFMTVLFVVHWGIGIIGVVVAIVSYFLARNICKRLW